ncbi:MAG: sensor histidine kinase [Bacteroidia bacterium]
MFRNFDFSKLRPVFSEKEKNDIKLYYAFSKEYEKIFEEQATKDFENHPILGSIIRSIPKEVQEANNKESDRLLREAIFDDKWEPYIKNLMMQGVQYANMGLDFKTWYEVVATVRKYYTPVLEKIAPEDQSRVSSIQNGTNVLFDFIMCTIGESFIHTRNRTIEAQNKKLEGMIKELESFAYIISHDLKTPLRGIASLSDWIMQDYGDKLDDTGKEYITLMKSRVVRLEALIDGVLEYSRAGRTDAQIVKTDLNKLVEDVIEMISARPNVKITVDNKLPELPVVKSAMTQVFSNLITNAIKHNDKENIIINVGCIEKPEEWLFYVKDNGPGIEKEFHEKVFKIFQTLKTKDEMNSTGIGLSVVKKIVDSAGGTIWIESEMGKGTAFFFTFKK